MIFDGEATNNHEPLLLVKVKSAVQFNQQLSSLSGLQNANPIQHFPHWFSTSRKGKKFKWIFITGHELRARSYKGVWASTHAHIHAHTCSHTYPPIRTPTLTHMVTHTHAHTHMLTHNCSHTHAPRTLELSWFKWIYEQNYFTKTPKTQWPEGGANKKCKFFFSSIWIFSRLPPTPWAS